MINLKFINKAVELTEGNEFRLLYVIANTISLKKEGHTKIYRDMLADKLGLSTKQISRLTDSLVEKGLLKKDLVSENDKTVNYYSLNLDKIDQKRTSKVDKNVSNNGLNLDKNVPLNKSKKEIIKEIKDNKIEKEIIKDNKKEIKEDIKTNKVEIKKEITTESDTPKNCKELLMFFDKKIEEKCKDKTLEELNEIQESLTDELKEFENIPSWRSVYFAMRNKIEKKKEKLFDKTIKSELETICTSTVF